MEVSRNDGLTSVDAFANLDTLVADLVVENNQGLSRIGSVYLHRMLVLEGSALPKPCRRFLWSPLVWLASPGACP